MNEKTPPVCPADLAKTEHVDAYWNFEQTASGQVEIVVCDVYRCPACGMTQTIALRRGGPEPVEDDA